MFQGYVKVDVTGFYGRFNDLLIVYLRIFSVISMILTGYFVSVMRVSQGYFKRV